MKFKNILLFFLVLIFAISCVPSKETEENTEMPAERLVKKLEGNRRKIKNFEGTGIMNVVSPELSAKTNFQVKLQKPDSIYLAVYGPFNLELARVLIEKNSFVFYDVMNNKAYKGGMSSSILKEVFKVNLSFEDLMDAFSGAVNLTGKLRENPDIFNLNDSFYEMTYIDTLKNLNSFYLVNSDNLGIKEFKLTELSGKEVLTSSFSAFKVFDEVAIPYKILISNSEKGQKLDIDFRSVEVNKKNVEIKFEIPEDVEIVEWKE